MIRMFNDECVSIITVGIFHIAGECLPLPAPSGWREQELPVRLEMEV